MKCNCVSAVSGDIKQSSELRMKYLKGEVKIMCRETKART